MNTANFNRYQMKLSKSDYQCLAINGEKISHFIAPDTERGIQKLYVLKDGGEVYYIGVTSQPMSARLRLGYRANGEHGYHGYKWIGKISRAELLIWCLTEGEKNSAEAIEGEFVYLVRHRTGRWPTYQMEIHFHSDATDREKQIAETLFEECF